MNLMKNIIDIRHVSVTGAPGSVTQELFQAEVEDLEMKRLLFINFMKVRFQEC